MPERRHTPATLPLTPSRLFCTPKGCRAVPSAPPEATEPSLLHRQRLPSRPFCTARGCRAGVTSRSGGLGVGWRSAWRPTLTVRTEVGKPPRNGGAGNHPLRSFLAPGGPVPSTPAPPPRSGAPTSSRNRRGRPLDQLPTRPPRGRNTRRPTPPGRDPTPTNPTRPGPHADSPPPGRDPTPTRPHQAGTPRRLDPHQTGAHADSTPTSQEPTPTRRQEGVGEVPCSSQPRKAARLWVDSPRARRHSHSRRMELAKPSSRMVLNDSSA